ncbi:MAG TPA: methyltransferase domain-containing protein [Candidatus Acidoferrum sp.]
MLTMRQITEKELIHERLGDEFVQAISDYDTGRRLSVLIDEFLPAGWLAGKRVLDVGTGLGFFAERLQQRGAKVTAVDIGNGLLNRVRQRVGCECLSVDALELSQYFGEGAFDVVLSSECIEHTPSPERALREMCKVLRPGGHLSISTPNRIWYPVVRAATLLRLRPYDGFENFSSFQTIRATLESEQVMIMREKGLHLIPFQLPLQRLSRWCDENVQALRGCMINLCVLAQKKTVAKVSVT